MKDDFYDKLALLKEIEEELEKAWEEYKNNKKEGPWASIDV